MQPLVFTLPDDLRDALAAACKTRGIAPTHIKADLDTRNVATRQVVLDILFHEQVPAQHRAFLDPFHHALLAMQRAEGIPAICLQNLPSSYEQAVMDGLIQMFGKQSAVHGYQYITDASDTLPNAAHRDYHSNVIRQLTCVHPGAPRQPTFFLTADEVLSAMACQQVGLPVASPPEEISASPQAEMHAEALAKWIEHFTKGRPPFLMSNPHYAPGTGAPRYTHYAPNYKQPVRFHAAARALRDEICPASPASIEPHSAVLWNDNALFHGKGLSRFPCAEPPATRRLFSSLIPFTAQVGQKSSEKFIGAPISEIRR